MSNHRAPSLLLVPLAVALSACPADAPPAAGTGTPTAPRNASPREASVEPPSKTLKPDGPLPVLDSCGALADSQNRCGPVTQLSARVPGDVCRPSEGFTLTSSAVEHMAWRTLVALLWPAGDGAPDPEHVVGDHEGGVALRPVLETWRSPDDLETLAGESGVLELDDWFEEPPLPASCSGSPGTLVLRYPGKVRPETAEALPEEHPARAAWGGPAIDQNGGVVFVDTRINRTAWDVVVGGGFYRGDRELRGLDFPNNLGDTKYGVGAMTVQTAWVEMPPEAELAGSGLFVREALILDELGDKAVCQPARVGLVGMQIGHKAAVGDDTWVWSVFEVAALAETEQLGAGADRQYMFSSGECTDPGPAVCDGVQPGAATDAARCCPNVDLHGPLAPEASVLERRTPTELTRVEGWSDASGCSQAYREALAGTPLSTMFLVGSQYWEDLGAETVRFGVEPAVLRSLVLEPWAVKRGDDGEPDAISSCVACHQTGDDGTFFLRAVRNRTASPPDVSPSSPPDASPSEPTSAPE